MNSTKMKVMHTEIIGLHEDQYLSSAIKPILVHPVSKPKSVNIADVLSIENNKLVIDLEQLDGIEIRGSSSKTMTFLASLILESKKHVFINSNFDDESCPNKYKLWMNSVDPVTKERISNEDLEQYANLQYDLEKNKITDFSYKDKPECSCESCGGKNASSSETR